MTSTTTIIESPVQVAVPTREELTRIVARYAAEKHELDIWADAVLTHFRKDPDLNAGRPPVIHSIKSRVKDAGHLHKKLERKWVESGPFTPDNLFDRITDLAGVRVLHLHQTQFPLIHARIMKKVDSGDWRLSEPPVAYSWDPDAKSFYENLGLTVDIKESYYTSIHYLIRSPNPKSIVCCELQVRTLFEEIWGEIDHAINYPERIDNLACREQIKVLARLVSTGTRLADGIFSCFTEYSQQKANAPKLRGENEQRDLPVEP